MAQIDVTCNKQITTEHGHDSTLLQQMMPGTLVDALNHPGPTLSALASSASSASSSTSVCHVHLAGMVSRQPALFVVNASFSQWFKAQQKCQSLFATKSAIIEKTHCGMATCVSHESLISMQLR